MSSSFGPSRFGGGMKAADRPSRGVGKATTADLTAKRPKPATEEGHARGLEARQAAPLASRGQLSADDHQPSLQLRPACIFALSHQQRDVQAPDEYAAVDHRHRRRRPPSSRASPPTRSRSCSPPPASVSSPSCAPRSSNTSAACPSPSTMKTAPAPSSPAS